MRKHLIAKHIIVKYPTFVLALLSLLMLASCHGMFDDIYDDANEGDKGDKENTLVVDASSWTDWHYVKFSQLTKSKGVNETITPGKGSNEALGVITLPIPTEAEGDTLYSAPADELSGIYVRWYDVFGEGLSRNEFRHFYPVSQQDEPADWDIALHRNNVRTNGGAVYETELTSFDDLPESSQSFADAAFVEDEWNVGDVWTVQDRMLQGLIGSQGIKVNPVLSSWLSVHIPPIPPSFTHNNHVFIVRFKDGTYAALQLANYMSAKGVKCYLTINYKYPY